MQMNIQEMATAVALELPLVLCVFNNGYLGNVRQWQELFFNKRYSSTCLRYRRSCERNCTKKDTCCPKYTPDFVKLAESYDAYGIRVTSEEDIDKAFDYADSHKNAPTIIEFIIEREDNVSPMVPGINNNESEKYMNKTNNTSKRWISLFVENDIGVLAKISGLFSGKSYNLDSLTVGVTEDPTVSRMTISVTSDDITFE